MIEGIDHTGFATLEDLEARLQRLEYFLSGSDEPSQPLEAAVSKGREHSIAARLLKLEYTIQEFSERSPAAHDLLQLQHAHPALFDLSKSERDAIPSQLSTEEILAIVAAHAAHYHQTASLLTSIRDLAIPSSSLSTSLISLQPRIAKVQSLQAAQGKEMAALRAGSAKAIQRWYELGVLGQGECWAEWEGRMEECEKRTRRIEGDRKRATEEQERYLT
ncbi:MAG: hypothetical protein Q9186_002648 [Xanthomendoza sp. 1 TL-2023]